MGMGGSAGARGSGSVAGRSLGDARRWRRAGGGSCVPLDKGGRRAHGPEWATMPSGPAGLLGQLGRKLGEKSF
jgi:hypothetical protein